MSLTALAAYWSWCQDPMSDFGSVQMGGIQTKGYYLGPSQNSAWCTEPLAAVTKLHSIPHNQAPLAGLFLLWLWQLRLKELLA